jgi:pimeloyl-ACP methyl ester carboxylesterase
VLLVTGEHDAKFGRIAAVMATACADVRHVVVPRAGHAVHLERPDAFAAALETFLEEQEDDACRSNG